jgi:hypothetical protein
MAGRSLAGVRVIDLAEVRSAGVIGEIYGAAQAE